MDRKLTFSDVLSEGFSIGVKNALSLIAVLLLWILTIWIPYINVGTTIAVCSIPVELSKGGILSPLFIFDAKYRQYMGEFFTLIGLMLIAIIPAFIFMIIPAFIIGIGWSLAIFIMLDKEVTPTKALLLSNKVTNSYKWVIFGVGFLLQLIALGFSWIVSELGALGILLSLPISAIITCIGLGCTTVFYKRLFLDNDKIESQFS